jgi:hypothetical protein
MKLQLAALADYANIAQGGKLNLMGVFDVIGTRSFPVIHPSMVLALRLRFEYEDGDREHKVQVFVVDEDGRQIARAEGMIRPPRLDPGKWISSNHILTFQQVHISKAGTVSFDVYCDGSQEQRLPLQILQLPPAEPRTDG